MATQQAHIKNKIRMLNLLIYVKSLQVMYKNIWRKMKKQCNIWCYG